MRKVLVAALVALVCTSSSRAKALFYVDWTGQVSYSGKHPSGTGGLGGGPVMRLGLEYGGITHESKGTHINVGALTSIGLGYKFPRHEGLSHLWSYLRVEPFLRLMIALSPDTDLALGGAASTGFDTARAQFGWGTGSGHAQAFVTGGARHRGIFVEGGLGRGYDTLGVEYPFYMGQAHYNFELTETALGLNINQLGIRVETLTGEKASHVIAQFWLGSHF